MQHYWIIIWRCQLLCVCVRVRECDLVSVGVVDVFRGQRRHHRRFSLALDVNGQQHRLGRETEGNKMSCICRWSCYIDFKAKITASPDNYHMGTIKDKDKIVVWLFLIDNISEKQDPASFYTLAAFGNKIIWIIWHAYGPHRHSATARWGFSSLKSGNITENNITHVNCTAG